MKGAPIETVADMSFVFSSTNPDTFQKNFTTEEISLPTSASGSYEQPIPDEGQELYNQNGFRIVGKYVEEDTLWGAGMVLFVENTSGSDILLTSSSMSINGFMVTPYFSTQVNDGRVALASITILSTDLEANEMCIRDSSNPQTSLMIFCNPHNPCGIIWTCLLYTSRHKQPYKDVG